MMDYSQLDASSSDGPGIQYDESGEGSERRTPSPDGGSPSEGESLQLEPPSEGGHLRPSLRPSLRSSLQLYLHPSPYLPPHCLRETAGSDLRNHPPVIRSEVVAQGLVRPPKTASHEKEGSSFLLEQNESTALVKWSASTSTMRSASVNSHQR